MSRWIDHNNCPSNVATFVADTVQDAVYEAHDILMQDSWGAPKYQGAVWLRQEECNEIANPADLALVRPSFERQRVRVYDYKQPTPSANLTKNFLVDWDQPALQHNGRVSKYKDLSGIFSKVAYQLRLEGKNQIVPHFDYNDENSYKKPDQKKLFGGRSIRIVWTENADDMEELGTHVYDVKEIPLLEYFVLKKSMYNPDGTMKKIIIQPHMIVPKEIERQPRTFAMLQIIKLPEPWIVRPNDWFFATSYQWEPEKLIPHSPPEFEAPDFESARILNTFDCHP